MGLFTKLFKKELELQAIEVSDDAVIAPADGHMISITEVPDPVFSQKMMGDGVAFHFDKSNVTICAPANGTLTAFFPTGHAFGITMNNGVEVLVHIGIDTVEANGDGFRLHSHKQGDTVKAGEPLVDVDVKKLGAKYDMSTMLIITIANGHTIRFIEPQDVVRGQRIIK